MTEKHPAPLTGDIYAELIQYLNQRIAEIPQIPDERKHSLTDIAKYIRQCWLKSEPARLTFICTHNSRRSQFSQVWAQLAADFFGLRRIETYSGGIEVTSFNPRAVAALQRCGLNISSEDLSVPNPRYVIQSFVDSPPLICFSKLFLDPPNPKHHFCAVMTCSDADSACPTVTGCDLRIPIRYDDPKVSDGKEFEVQVYAQRSAQICREMLYLMRQVSTDSKTREKLSDQT
jgi:arsenate reductase